MNLHIGIDIDLRGAIAGIGPDGRVMHHPVMVQELGNDRFLDVNGNQAILDGFAAHFGVAKEEVFVAYEQSRKNPKFGTIGNFVMGKNGEFWRVLMAKSGYSHCSVNPQTWQKHVFQGVRGLDTKAMAALVVQRRFPSVTYGQYTAEQIKGINDSILIALWARENHN
jgi:hypothetical protein